MERWDLRTHVLVADERIDAFLEEIAEVCKRHGYSISHEDGYGGLIVEPYDETNIAWLRVAMKNVEA